MPVELRRLFVCQTIGWLAFYSTTLFFTDYIAQVIIKLNILINFFKFKIKEYLPWGSVG